MKNIFGFIFFLLFLTTIVYSHGGKDHKKEKIVKHDTLTIVGRDTIAINGLSKNLYKKEIKPEVLKEEPEELNLSAEMFEHLHNKLVHFPVALGVFAFFLTLLNFKWKKFDSAILISVLIALLFSIGAFITGKNQSEPFMGTGKEWIVELHQNFGIAVLINYFIWTIFLVIEKLKKYAWMIGCVLFVLVLVTGFLGGVIAH